jgi:predicted AlkP superfamily phosphohydrolase/phosphomutase
MPPSPRRPRPAILESRPGPLRAAILLAAALVTLRSGPAKAQDARPGPPYDRVVILGFDGADAGLVTEYLAEGRLPNLARLQKQGMYSPLRSTNPPQTPVSWSTFATGLNPGRTEIFDFLRRTEGTYYPDFAMIHKTHKPLLFGPRNPPMLGILVGVAAALLTAVAALLLRTRRGLAIAAGLLVGGAAGGVMALAAKHWLPDALPDAENGRKGTPFWDVAAAAGVPSRVIHVPATFPAENHEGLTMLSGLGVPDMRGRIGSPSYFTSDASLALADNQFSIQIVNLDARRGRIATALVGPLNEPFWNEVIAQRTAGLSGEEKDRVRDAVKAELRAKGVRERLDVPFSIDVTDADLTVDLAGQRRTLKPGDWSDWFVVPVRVNPLVDLVAGLRGMVRFKLLALDPEVRLYMSPLMFHPLCQPVPFAAPHRLASDLLGEFGLFKTLGWPIDTWSLPSGLTDERHFLEDMEFTVKTERAMMASALKAKQARLYVQVFDFTDRVGHMLWRLHDPQHPMFDQALADKYAGEIPKAYELMDAIVGDAMASLGPKDALVVCSDHGFASFRRGVNYNTWLVKNGLMTLREPPSGGKTLEDLFDRGELGGFFKYVDWTRTKAYAMGLGNIYVNLLGREPKGSVAPGREYEEVREAVVRGLESLVDPETGEKPVTRVYRREEIYSGFDPRLVPDLRVANGPHHRVGWQTSLGEVPPQIFENNRKAWSGDHCSNDPAVVPGILFSNVPLDAKAPFIGDLFPTTLALLGIPPPQGIDGRSLLP